MPRACNRFSYIKIWFLRKPTFLYQLLRKKNNEEGWARPDLNRRPTGYEPVAPPV